MNYMEEDKAVRNFIIIFIIVLLFVVGIYFFTAFINKDNDSTNNDTNTTSDEVNIDYSKVIVGTMLEKDGEYYVLLYKSDADKASEYSSLVSSYKTKSGALPIYTVDLSDGLNSKYYDKDNVKLSASNVEDLRFGDITLLKVKDNKIVKSFDSVDKIKKELK